MFSDLKDLKELVESAVDNILHSIPFRYIIAILILFSLQNYYFEDLKTAISKWRWFSENLFPFFLPFVIFILTLILIKYFPNHFKNIESNTTDELLRKLLKDIEIYNTRYNLNDVQGIIRQIYIIFANSKTAEISATSTVTILRQQIEEWSQNLAKADAPGLLYELTGQAILVVARISRKHNIKKGLEYIDDWVARCRPGSVYDKKVFVASIQLAKLICDKKLPPDINF